MWDFLLMLRPSALLGSSQSQHPLMYLGCLEEKYDRHLFVTQTAVVAMKNMRMTTVKTFSVDPEHQGSRRRAPGGVQILLCRGAGEPSRCGISKERAPSTGLFKRQIKKCARWRPDTANDALHMVRTSESGIDDSFMSDHGKSPETPAFKADLGGD